MPPTLKPDVMHGVTLLIVREPTSCVCCDEPHGTSALPDSRRRGANTQVYTSDGIIRAPRVASDLARNHNGQLWPVELADVLESGVLWRVVKLHPTDFRDMDWSRFTATPRG